MINSHLCQCAACNNKRYKEEESLKLAAQGLQSLIDSGALDHLKIKTDSKVQEPK